MLDDSPLAKSLAGEAALKIGQGYGVGRGVWNMGRDTVDGVLFAGRLLNPLDPFLSAPDDAAWDHVAGAAGGAWRYVTESTPEDVAHDFGDFLIDQNRRLNPSATAQAPTLGEEFRRNFEIGANQAELGVEIGSTVVGGAGMKALSKVGKLRAFSALPKAERITEYMRRGYPKHIAEYFAEPYEGMGSHWIPRRTKVPDWAGGGDIPKGLMDSQWNVLMPEGLDKGSMFELHYGVDLSYKGGPVRGRSGKGSGWSGGGLGWVKDGELGRLVHGMPETPANVAAFGFTPAGLLGATDELWTQDDWGPARAE